MTERSMIYPCLPVRSQPQADEGGSYGGMIGFLKESDKLSIIHYQLSI